MSERDTLKAEANLREFALSFPETREEFPWGERAFKVAKKVFLFMRASEDGLSLSVKLPLSSDAALEHKFANPTGYGLGKSGWVTAVFSNREKPPLELLKTWIRESFKAIAPKKILASTDAKSSEIAKKSVKKTASKKKK